MWKYFWTHPSHSNIFTEIFSSVEIFFTDWQRPERKKHSIDLSWLGRHWFLAGVSLYWPDLIWELATVPAAHYICYTYTYISDGGPWYSYEPYQTCITMRTELWEPSPLLPSPLVRSGWRLQLWTWWGHWGNQYRHHTPHRELKTQIIEDKNSSHIYKSDFKILPGWQPYRIIELQLNWYREWFII